MTLGRYGEIPDRVCSMSSCRWLLDHWCWDRLLHRSRQNDRMLWRSCTSPANLGMRSCLGIPIVLLRKVLLRRVMLNMLLRRAMRILAIA